jgi:hypothetical protein
MLGHAKASNDSGVPSDLFPEDLDAVADAFDRAVLDRGVGFLWQ